MACAPQTAEERIAQGQEQAQHLHQYYQELGQTVQDFLADMAKERTTNAEEQKQQLHQFRQDLFVSIFGTSLIPNKRG